MSYPGIIKYPVGIRVIVYVVDDRKRDADNMLTSIQDLLVLSGILQKDNWQLLNPVSIFVAGIDREQPRAEIYLYSQKQVPFM